MEESVYDILAEQPPYCCPRSCSTSTGMPCQEETTGNSCKECTYSESSASSTPFVSAPSSPKRSTPLGYYLLTRASLAAIPTPSEAHDKSNIVDNAASVFAEDVESALPASPSLSEFEFSSRFSEADAWLNPSNTSLAMSTAEELFHNGKIRPLNTRMCPTSYSYACFGEQIHHDTCIYDTCHPYACREWTPSPSTALHQQQHLLMRKQKLGHITKPAYSGLSALEQWKQTMGRYDIKKHSRHANGHHVERVMHASSWPLACYRKSGGGCHRRARSLSPLRVFHMDDMMMQARPSFESGNMQYTNTKISHAADVGTIMRCRRSMESWTLKELLNIADLNKVHDTRPQLQGSFNHTVEKRSLAEERLYNKSGTHHEEVRSACNSQKGNMEEHAQLCYNLRSQRAQEEEIMKKRSFLRCKRGLLGCLGFTSELSSIKGLHAMQE